jgi:hypothetical protein
MMSASKHAQLAILSGLSIVSGLTIALVGAQNVDPLPAYALSFITTEPNVITDTGNPFAGAKFDIQSYVSSPCYDIVGNEQAMCASQYGITTPLKQYVIDGSLLQYLNNNGLLAKAAIAADQPSSPSEVITPNQNPNDAYDMEHRARNEHLWSVCKSKYADYSDAAFCFQRNIKLARRFGMAIDDSQIK